MTSGIIVKFKNPLTEGEKGWKMRVLDWYEDSPKCLVEDITDLPLKGTHIYFKCDLVEA